MFGYHVFRLQWSTDHTPPFQTDGSQCNENLHIKDILKENHGAAVYIVNRFPTEVGGIHEHCPCRVDEPRERQQQPARYQVDQNPQGNVVSISQIHARNDEQCEEITTKTAERNDQVDVGWKSMNVV